MAATAAVLRLLRRSGRGASAPPSAMMQSLFRGSCSPAVVATLPAVHYASPPVQYRIRRYTSKVVKRDLKDNKHSLLDQVKNFEEADEMLGKQLHKGNTGKESSADLVVELTEMLKRSDDLCKTVRRHLDLQSSFDNQSWMILFSHMHTYLGFLIKSAMVGVAALIIAVVMPISRVVSKQV